MPVNVADPDTAAVELGVKFYTNKSIKVTGIRFYRGPENAGPYSGRIWSGNKVLGTVTFPNSTTVGWQEARFSTPISVAKGTSLVASYVSPKGRYSGDVGGFSTAITDGTVTHPESAGVYNYAVGKLPTNVWQNANYFVDIFVHSWFDHHASHDLPDQPAAVRCFDDSRTMIPRSPTATLALRSSIFREWHGKAARRTGRSPRPPRASGMTRPSSRSEFGTIRTPVTPR